MAYPTTPVIDDFNRANGGLGASWSGRINSGDNDPTIVSNVLDVPNASAVWAASFSNDQEAYLTVTALGGAADVAEVWCRITGEATTSPNGYVARTTFNGVGSINMELYKVTAATPVQLSTTFTGAFVVGNKFGIEAIGTQISFYQFSGGSWAQRVTATDATWASGKIGFFGTQNAANTHMDDFGGGSAITAGVYPLPSFARISYNTS